MGSISESTVRQISTTGSEEDFANLLKTAGTYHDTKTNERTLDKMFRMAAEDKNDVRKARKIALAAAYDAHGEKVLKKKTRKRPELKTLKQLAFKGASENVVELLKAQAKDAEAQHAIIEGAQRDRKRFLRRETTADNIRRSNKKDIVTEFHAQSGRFATIEEPAPAALDAQLQIAELTNRLAEMEKRVENQIPAVPAKSMSLKL